MSDERVAQAVLLHQQGNLQLAEVLYREALRTAPRHAQALGMLGLIEAGKGNREAATDLLSRSIESDPGNPATHFNLGLVHQDGGQHQQALESMDRALALKPAMAPLHNGRGMALKGLGRYDDAVTSYDAALRLQPRYFEAHNNKGVALRYLGRFEEAADSFGRALEANPQSPDVHNNMGQALHRLARYPEALASYARALQLKPGFDAALNNQGLTLHAIGRYDEALASFRRALDADPSSAQTVMNMGVSLYEARRFDEALSTLRRALEMQPGCADTQVNLGNVLLELDRHEEALALYRGVLAAGPTQADVLMNVANALRDTNRHVEAVEHYDRALAIDASNADVHWNRSLCLLAMGDYERGWPEYEWRLRNETLYDVHRAFNAPLWSGTEPLAGKTILLHAEQGLGDTLQFCRYAGEVARQGARVILEVQPPLVPVLVGLDGVARLLVRGDATGAYDFHGPLLSLPFALKTRLDNVPATVPYLRCDPALQARWREVVGHGPGLRIGLAWSGNLAYRNNHRRSIGLERLLAALPPRAQCWSLQKDVSEADQRLVEAGRVRRFELNDFVHTAAQVAAMDVVISVDTSIAHLAAALGKTTWLLLSYKADWRWLSGRDDSPWYPHIRLFRQASPGDWDSALAHLSNAAAELSASRS